MGLMGFLMRFRDDGRLLPNKRAVIAIKAQKFELQSRKFAGFSFIGRNGRRDKHLVVPDHWRR